MVKKILGTVLILALLSVAVVQAIEKDRSEDKIITQPATKNISVEKMSGIKVGLKAPDFELETLEGKKVKLSDFAGKKVMLNFWATWCPPCKAEMPHMQKFYEEAGDKIQILAVNIDPKNNVAGFAEEMNLHFPILLDKNDKVMKMYQILSIPTTYFIDEDGIIRNKFIGAMSLDKMREFFENF